MPNFGEVIIAFVTGWTAAMLSTWLVLSKPWLDRRLLPSRRIPVQSVSTPALNPVQQTGPIKVM